jgi:hypothetical protein
LREMTYRLCYFERDYWRIRRSHALMREIFSPTLRWHGSLLFQMMSSLASSQS